MATLSIHVTVMNYRSPSTYIHVWFEIHDYHIIITTVLLCFHTMTGSVVMALDSTTHIRNAWCCW